MEATVERTNVNLLRPTQVADLERDREACRAKLQSPHIEDKGTVRNQLQRIERMLQDQVPHAPQTMDEEGRLVRRARELQERMLEGMPSQEEMRKCPPGAVGKHRSWEARNKANLIEWKNIQLRLNRGTNDPDVANFERHRPVSSTLNMDNALIPGKQIHLGDFSSGLPVPFTDEQIKLLRELNPAVADQLASMNNAQRAEVKRVVVQAQDEGIGLSAQAKDAAPAKGKRTLSPEHLAKMAAGREAKKAAKAKA